MNARTNIVPKSPPRTLRRSNIVPNRLTLCISRYVYNEQCVAILFEPVPGPVPGQPAFRTPRAITEAERLRIEAAMPTAK